MTLPNTPYLLLRTNTGNHHFPLANSNYWTLGRGSNNHFIVKDHWISRHHIILQYLDGGQFYLIDLGSRNGTFVNGRRVNIPVTLKDKDRIVLGQTELEFHIPIPEKETVLEEDDEDHEKTTSTLHVRRLMSVMVVDIRDFTVLSRTLDESTLSLVIGSWFRQAGEILRDSGSWVDKYIGDAVMAIWFHGEKEVAQEEIIQIFRAISDLWKMTTDLGNQYPLPFNLRIGAGVNTGYAMVGNTGSGDRPDYTAIGDTVNAAFRLESATKELGLDIALGETTYNYLQEFRQTKPRFTEYSVNLKGYDQPTITYAASFEALDSFLIDKFVLDHQTLI